MRIVIPFVRHACLRVPCSTSPLARTGRWDGDFVAIVPQEIPRKSRAAREVARARWSCVLSDGERTFPMRRNQVLVVDGEENNSYLVSSGLRAAGFDVETAASAEDVISKVVAAQPDAIVSLLMLPDGDGYSVLRRLRARGCTAPVLFLTARSSTADRVQAPMSREWAADTRRGVVLLFQRRPSFRGDGHYQRCAVLERGRFRGGSAGWSPVGTISTEMASGTDS